MEQKDPYVSFVGSFHWVDNSEQTILKLLGVSPRFTTRSEYVLTSTWARKRGKSKFPRLEIRFATVSSRPGHTRLLFIDTRLRLTERRTYIMTGFGPSGACSRGTYIKKKVLSVSRVRFVCPDAKIPKHADGAR